MLIPDMLFESVNAGESHSAFIALMVFLSLTMLALDVVQQMAAFPEA